MFAKYFWDADESNNVLFFSAWANKLLVQSQLKHAELITHKTWSCGMKSILYFLAPGTGAPVVSDSESLKEVSGQIGPKNIKWFTKTPFALRLPLGKEKGLKIINMDKSRVAQTTCSGQQKAQFLK